MKGRSVVKRLWAGVVALALLSYGWVPEAHARQTVSTSFSMPARLEASVTVPTFECENSPGPQITFEGAISLGGVDVQLIFRNNINKDVHTRVEDVQVATGVAAGETIVIPKQPSHPVEFPGGTGTGVGGNPWISVQLLDTNGNPLSGEILLGRCVQGAFAPTVDFFTPALAQAAIDVLDCTNNPGPFINVSGSASFSPGVKARFIFRNQRTDGAPHEATAIVDVTLMTEGFTLQFPKQPVLGGVGGNPWISVQFVGGGQPIGNEFLLGRCVQLMPGN